MAAILENGGHFEYHESQYYIEICCHTICILLEVKEEEILLCLSYFYNKGYFQMLKMGLFFIKSGKFQSQFLKKRTTFENSTQAIMIT